MEGSNVERVRVIFDRYAEGGIEGAMEFLDEDVLIEIPPELSCCTGSRAAGSSACGPTPRSMMR